MLVNFIVCFNDIFDFEDVGKCGIEKKECGRDVEEFEKLLIILEEIYRIYFI